MRAISGLGIVVAFSLLLGFAKPGGQAPAGRVLYVALDGNDANNGSVSAPWRTIGKAASAAVAGDTVIIRGGTYAESLVPANAGKNESSRIVFKAAPGEVVVLDGGTGPLQGGWTDEGHGIYSRPMDGIVYGVFQDTYEAVGKHANLWDMGRYNVLDSNPNFEIHDFDPTHDWYDANGTLLPKHDGFSQFKHANGVLRVRTYDGSHPDAHNIRAARKEIGIDITGKRYITVEGIRVRHFKYCVGITQSPSTRLVNCDIRYAAWTAVWLTSSNDSEVLNCVIQGGGSWLGHYEDSVNMSGTDRARWEGNDISYGGHGTFLILGGSGFILRNNYIHDAGGSLLTMKESANNGLIELNVLARAPTSSEVRIHKVPHAGFQLTGSNNTFRRNVFYKSGFGALISTNESEYCNNNTFYGSEADGIQLEGYAASNRGRLNGNLFKNNIVAGSGWFELRLDLPGGDTTNFWDNRFEANCFWGAGLRAWTSTVSVSGAQARWPAAFTRNVAVDPRFANVAADDYRLQPDSPLINAGANVGLPYAGSAPDIGAYETNGLGPTPRISPN
jgi:hypothetical protein